MTTSKSRAGLDHLHTAMAARIDRNELPGMVTLIAQGDDVHVDATGVKAFDSTEPMRRETLFRIASLTKPILAAAAIMTNFETGQLELRPVSTPDEWTRPPAFPSGAGGLVSTVDDFLAFARLLLNKGSFAVGRLLTEKSVELMTTNHLTPEQIAGGGILLGGRGWGFGMGVVTEPEADWPVPGRYGWSGGYGTTWFNDPHRGIVAIAMTQVSDFLWNGGLVEFEKLVGAI